MCFKVYSVKVAGCDGFALTFLIIIILHQSLFPQQHISSDSLKMQVFKTTLQELLDASHNNPRLTSADAKISAASASIDGKKSLDPPLLAVEFYQSPVASFPNPFKDQMEYDYSIQQMIPFPGKLGSMADVARKQAKMFKTDRQTQEQDIIRNVKTLYFELYFKDRQMEMNHENLKLIRVFVDIAQKQYQVGMGNQSDVLRAQTELSSFGSDSIVLLQERKSMEGMLNALCNRSPLTVIDVIPEIKPVIPDYDVRTLMAIAEKHRPEIASMHTGIAMQQAESLAARKEYLPDFMVRGTYKQMLQRTDDWGLMIGATLPIAPWSSKKYAAQTQIAIANITVVQNELANMKNMIAAEVNDAFLQLESGKARLALSKSTSVPQAERTLEVALAAYRTGKQEFFMVLDIQRMLVMARLDYHMAVMTLLDSQGRLERAVGLSADDIDISIKGEHP